MSQNVQSPVSRKRSRLGNICSMAFYKAKLQFDKTGLAISADVSFQNPCVIHCLFHCGINIRTFHKRRFSPRHKNKIETRLYLRCNQTKSFPNDSSRTVALDRVSCFLARGDSNTNSIVPVFHNIGYKNRAYIGFSLAVNSAKIPVFFNC